MNIALREGACRQPQSPVGQFVVANMPHEFVIHVQLDSVAHRHDLEPIGFGTLFDLLDPRPATQQLFCPAPSDLQAVDAHTRDAKGV